MSDVLVLRYVSEVTIIRGDPPTQIIQNTPVTQVVIQREGIAGPRGPRGLPGGGTVVDGDWGDVVITGAGTDDEHWAVPDLANKADLTGAEFTGPVEVPPEPYSPEWEDSNEVVTKADIFNKFESLVSIQEIAFIIDAGNNPIQPGVKGDIRIPYDCEIIGWAVLADQVGNISVDIERETFGSFPPDQADDITGTNPPKLINQNSASGDATSWLSTIVANSVLRYRVTSADTVKRVTISLTVEKVL